MRYSMWMLSLAALALCSGCAQPDFYKNAKVCARQAQPPSGKALVNFHMPSKAGGPYLVPVFTENGDLIGVLKKASEFQWACEPGEHVVMGWAEVPGRIKSVIDDPWGKVGSIAVLKADVQADKIYDVLVDLSIGWDAPAILFTPMNKGNERRAKLPDYERREQIVSSGLQATEEASKYREIQQKRVADVKRDFLGGPKSARVHNMRSEDCR